MQAQYLFLAKYEIHNKDDLDKTIDQLNERKKELNAEKRMLNKEQAGFKPLFNMAKRLQELEPAELSYLDGDEFFSEEHEEYRRLSETLKSSGYTHEEVNEFRTHYDARIRKTKDASIEISKELHIADELMDEYETGKSVSSQEQNQEKTLSTRQSR